MIKTKPKKTGPEKVQAAILAQKAIRLIPNGKIAKTKGYGLKTKEYGRAHKIRGSEVPSKEPRIKILDKSFFPSKSAANLPLSLSLGSPRTVAVDVVKGILRNAAKASLASILVGGGIAVGTIYLVAKGRITKTDAFRHIIKGAAGGVTSGIIEIGTAAMLTTLSSLPAVAQIAVLTGVGIGVKKLWNRS
jgi:hypothetical protein